MNAHRIGVIGLGQRIAHVLGAMAEVGWMMEVAGYVDPAPVGLTILEEFGIDPGYAYPDVSALLADGPFDLVMIGSPNHLHLEHLTAAFAAGFPIFAEKPIVRTQAETLSLARALAGPDRVALGAPVAWHRRGRQPGADRPSRAQPAARWRARRR